MRNSRFVTTLVVALALAFVVRLSAWAQEGGDAEKYRQGAQIYAENCAVCHGENGEGRVGATLAKDWPSIRPDLAARATIANGVPGSPMPAWSQANGGPLTDEEIDAVVYFLLNWQTGGFPEITPRPTATAMTVLSPVPGVEGDPNRGAVLFDYNCKVCHGAGGEGRIGEPLNKTWASVRPDLAIKTTIAEGVEGSPMPAWSQANGGPLTEQEINDLVAFVLTLSESPVEQVATAAPETSVQASPLSGWWGVALAIVLFFLIVLLSQLLQRNSPR
ncbi:MAG: hypothetical protein D6803_00230 [Anaerolineae bacterium]|nr:MAG: hypothetical protein D6803_00230 [Anaerolineae bacterium]